jgi:outer membrane protein assembly factor BamE
MRRTVAFFAPYRADIIQGNVVTSDQMAKVKVGMTRAQVRDILGSPLIADPFHADRWDYVFSMQRQGIAPVKRSFVVRFQGETVSQIDAPELPSESEFVKDISVRPLPTSTPQLELTPEEKAKLPAPEHPATAAAPAAAASATGALRTYPPLEAS